MPEHSQCGWPTGRLMSVLAGSWMLLSHPVWAAFSIPGYELVYNAPQETTLQDNDLRHAAEVWQQMFDAARSHIDLAQFYVANEKGSLLDGVLARLRAAGERGVKIRFLMEEKGVGLSTPETLTALKATILTEEDWLEVAGFAFAHRPLLTSAGSLNRLLMLVELPLPALRARLQQQDETALCQTLGLSGRKALLARLREEAAQAMLSLDENRANDLRRQVQMLQFF